MCRFGLVTIVVVGLAQAASAQLPSLPGFAKSRRERQSDAAKKLYPAAIQLVAPEGAAPVDATQPRAIKVRVYAARDYRNQTFNWSSKVRRLVERVNKLVARWPAVRFELVELKPWDRDSAALGTEALLVELERLDPGADVDLVIGLIAAVPVLPTQIHNLAMARSPGRHFVMRSLHDLAELEDLRKYYDELPDDERDRLVAERKAHKELVVFLHEWAHTLGAIHAVRPDLIMNPEADAQQSHFSAPNAHVLELALRHRLAGGDGDEAALDRELAAYVRATPLGDWDAKDRDQQLAIYSGRPASSPPAQSAASVPSVRGDATISEPDRALFNRAAGAYNAKDVEGAWKTLEPLVAKYPHHPAVQLLACELAYRRAAGLTRWHAVEPLCRGAAQLARDDARPQLLLADLYVEAHLDEKAPSAIALAHQRLDYRAGAPAAEWQMLASLYQRTSAPSHAAEAAAHAGDETVRAVAEWALALRRRVGLPAGALPADRESGFVRAFEMARLAIEGGQKDAAPVLVANVEREYAALPGAVLLRCQLELSRNQLKAATAACTRALGAEEDLVAAHFYLGAMPSRSAPSKAQIAHLARVLELDPTVEPAWRLLARDYKATRDRAALEALRVAYEKQFHSPLP